ncbi:MAG: polysaccharide biosynthesis C-terminal domain-containing protein [Oscillospiraceae bacterium]|nr:polysaccharide biosynthesis C-terminal domain-containing protein [Oscillospiraceae bacterium]
MDRKIVKNYIYNILYQLVKIILPFILVRYTSVHIGKDALGIYNYAGSIMNWFILFGILGVNTYGNRQIAKVRDDEKLRNTTFFEILAMQMTNMIIAMIAFYIFIHFAVDKNAFYWKLTGLTMLASMLDISWFFFGVEDFKKASIRNIIVKCIGVFLIMTLCKTPDDLWLYILINVGSELFGQAIMFFQLREYLSFEKISLKDAYKHHFLATFQLFVPTIAISVYTMLDQTMVGALYSESHVTYYMTSMNIVKMFLLLITSIGSVMLPRVTNVVYNDENGDEKAQHYIATTMKFSMLLALPMCFGMMAIAQPFLSWYLPVWPIIPTLVMLGCPVIILISMSNVTGIQYMVPTGMYNSYSASVIAGSCVNFLINLFLIPRYGALGAIIGSVIAEATVTSIQMFLIRKKVKFNFLQRSYFIYVLATALMCAAVMAMRQVMPVNAFGTLAEVGAGMIVYFLVLLLSKEELTQKALAAVRNRGGKEHA